ncbi:MAG: hypothetical protein JKP98_03085 [Rhodobacteraceae bacterium]|nr:hypothetical protein [Paracoccaceae bacterium]
MSLTLVPDDTGDAAFLASAKVKSSGVHIGAGVYLSHNHNPYAANTSSATPHRGLDGEAAEATPTTAYDFTLPMIRRRGTPTGTVRRATGRFPVSMSACMSARPPMTALRRRC